MMKHMNKKLLGVQAAAFAGMLTAGSEAHAGGIGNNFGDIAENMVDSIEELPGLLTGVAYLFGLLLGVLGIVKVKDHVENPTQTPLKDGAIRLASGGALFALPIVYESMLNTIGDTPASVEPATLNAVEFNVN